MLFPSLVLLNADGVGATDMRTGTGVQGDSSDFLDLFACLLNLLTPHLATQWGEECLGINAVPLVSVLQDSLITNVVFKPSWVFHKELC